MHECTACANELEGSMSTRSWECPNAGCSLAGQPQLAMTPAEAATMDDAFVGLGAALFGQVEIDANMPNFSDIGQQLRQP